MEWTKVWPKQKGYYWFYGWRFKSFKDKPELSMVEVRLDSDKRPVYITRGHFLYKEEGANGFWQECNIPQLPKERLKKED